MSSIKVLLVCMNGPAKDAYIAALDFLNVEYDVANCFSDIYERYKKTRYSGFLFDVATTVRSKSKDKIQTDLLIDNFPVLRLNYRISDGTIRGIPVGRLSGSSSSLNTFIKDECAKFKPRSLRSSKRAAKNLNALLRREDSKNKGDIEKSISFNISERGGFFFSVAKWDIDESLSVVIKEFNDRSPISAKVQWVQPWGEKTLLPGIGVKFYNLTPKQADQLELLMSEK